jgi:hypothetical protein
MSVLLSVYVVWLLAWTWVTLWARRPPVVYDDQACRWRAARSCHRQPPFTHRVERPPR